MSHGFGRPEVAFRSELRGRPVPARPPRVGWGGVVDGRNENSLNRPTLKDVAREANVSPKTASRVLNNERYVRPEVRSRVKDAILRLGYRSNDLARTLKLGTTRTIGLVVADISNPFYSSCAQGVALVARRRGYPVLT